MDVLEYVLASAVWSVMGFTVGYFLGHMEREVHAIRQAVAPDENGEMPAGDDPANHDAVTKHLRRVLRTFGLLLLLLALLSVGQMAVTSLQAREAAACQNTINRALRADQLQRTQSVTQDWADLRRFLIEVENGIGSNAEVRAAVVDLNEILRERETARAANPPQAYIKDEC